MKRKKEKEEESKQVRKFKLPINEERSDLSTLNTYVLKKINQFQDILKIFPIITFLFPIW